MLHRREQDRRYQPALECVAAAVRLSLTRCAGTRPALLITVRVARQVLVALALSALAGVLCATLAEAATIPVTTTDDELNGGGSCSLREAIQSANTDGNVGGCVGTGLYGNDVITLPSGTYPITIDGRDEDLNVTGDFDVAGVLEIRPSGSGSVVIHGGTLDRVLHVLEGADLTLSGVTITGGSTTVPTLDPRSIAGGGMLVEGQTTVQDSTFTNNTTSGFGGGLFVSFSGTATLERVTMSNNTAGTAGAIFNLATLTVRASTIIDNWATDVGAISTSVNTTRLENVTVSRNRASHAGGMDVVNAGTLTLVNVTAVDNGSPGSDAGNLFANPNSTIMLQNTLLASPPAGTGNCTISGNGTIVSLGSNLSDDTSCNDFLTKPGDQNSAVAGVGTLQNNGGATQTFLLLPTSQALDVVVGDCVVGADQRGVSRPRDGDGNGFALCDIGAYERVPGTLQFAAPAFSASESDPAATIVLRRTGSTDDPVSATVSLAGGTATQGQDFTFAAPQTVTWANGDGADKIISIPMAQDPIDEPAETVQFTLTLTAGPNGAVLGAQTGTTLTIADDDATPSIVIQNISQAEGNSGTGTATFPVSLTNPSGQTITVQYTTGDGTATAGTDYSTTSGTLTFNPGETSGPIGVPILGDATVEPDEGFTVTLSNPSNATLGVAQAVGIIRNDDASLPTSPAPLQACAPRPRVATHAEAGGGALRVEIQATPLNTSASNSLREIRFGSFQNATVTLNGQTVSGGQTVTLPANVAVTELTVRRVTAGQPTTVPLTIVDGCGEWQTFVGGGASAGF